MNRRRLILAGGTVAFTAIGVVKRYRRPSRVSQRSHSRRVMVAVPVAGYVMFALPDMPDLAEIFLGFWSIANVIWDQIWSTVYGILQEAFTALEKAIDAAFAGIDWTLDAFALTVGRVAEASRTAMSAVSHVVMEVTDRMAGAFDNFRQQLTGWLENGYNVIRDWVVEQIPDILRAVLGGAWDVLEMLIEVGSEGISFLLNFLRDPIGVTWDLISDLVDQAIAQAMSIAGFTWDAFWGLFWPALADQLGVPDDPLDILRGAWWLLKVAWMIGKGDAEEVAREMLPGAMQYFEDQIRRLIGQERFNIEGWVADAMGVGNATGGALQ